MYVIRRELDIAEGDPINNLKFKQIREKIENENNLIIYCFFKIYNSYNLCKIKESRGEPSWAV